MLTALENLETESKSAEHGEHTARYTPCSALPAALPPPDACACDLDASSWAGVGVVPLTCPVGSLAAILADAEGSGCSFDVEGCSGDVEDGDGAGSGEEATAAMGGSGKTTVNFALIVQKC